MSRQLFRDLLNNEYSSFKNSCHLSFHQQHVFSHMINCQTENMGFNTESCPDCGYTHTHYNSCRDRHCVFCQSVERELWIQKYKSLLINTQYFHIVFTVPEKLNPIFLLNKSLMYNILFNASSKARLTMAESDNYGFGKIGLTSILHTWGQTLSFHSHVHYIVTGGGISDNCWVLCKKNDFMTVKAKSKVFRSLFLSLLSKQAKKLILTGDIEYLNNPYDFDNFISSLYNTEWVVYSKKSFEPPSRS